MSDLLNIGWLGDGPVTFASKRVWALTIFLAIGAAAWIYGLFCLISGRFPGWAKRVQANMSRISQSGWMAIYLGAYLVIILAALVPQVLLVLKGEAFVATMLTIDDTYYYLQTAWNTAHIGYVSFDGINPTNGVQLLWFFVLVILAFVIQVKTQYLIGMITLTIILNCACFFPIWMIGREIADRRYSFLLAVLWLFILVNNNIYLSGMENSLHALIMWMTLWVFLSTIRKINQKARPSLTWLTVCLCLLVLTRLDSVVYAGVIFIVAVALYFSQARPGITRRTFTPLLIPFAFISLSMLILFGSYKLMGGSWLPVSSYIKIANTTQVSFIQSLADYLRLGVPEILQSENSLMLQFIFAGGFILFLISTLLTKRNPLTVVAYSLLVSYVLYGLIIFLIDINYSPYSWWYRSPLYITHLLILAYGVLKISELITRWVDLHSLNVIVFLFLLTHGVLLSYQCSNQSINKDSIYFRRYQASLWLSQNLPEGSVLSSYNAGQFGYFSGHPVINLDGLINSYDFYKTVLESEDSIQATAAYLKNNRVDYFIDYAPHGLDQYFTPIKILDKTGMNGKPIILYAVR